jgi:hypothetical protein
MVEPSGVVDDLGRKGDINDRIRFMQDFKSFGSAGRRCRGYDELRNFLRSRARHNQPVSASCRRLRHRRRATAALALVGAA